MITCDVDDQDVITRYHVSSQDFKEAYHVALYPLLMPDPPERVRAFSYGMLTAFCLLDILAATSVYSVVSPDRVLFDKLLQDFDVYELV